MKHLISKALLILSASLLSAFFVSCYDEVPKAAEDGSASVVIKQTSSISEYQTFNFDMPANGYDKIYAERITSPEDAEAFAYVIKACSSYDYPFYALEVVLIPGYTNRKGEKIESSATIRVTEYEIDLEEAEEYNKELGRYEYGYEEPKTWFYTLNSSTGFSDENFRIPCGNEGVFKLEFATSDKFGVLGDEMYCDLINQTYPLLQLDVVCPVKL